MSDLRSALETLNAEQGAKVLLYCDTRGIQRMLVDRGTWALSITGIIMAALFSLDRSGTTLLHPYLNWVSMAVCSVAALYAVLSITMVSTIRGIRRSLLEIGVLPELIEQLDALPASALALRRTDK